MFKVKNENGLVTCKILLQTGVIECLFYTYLHGTLRLSSLNINGCRDATKRASLLIILL